MKNIYYILGLSLISTLTFTQDLQVSLSQGAACTGDAITVNVAGPEEELSTPVSIANNNSGVMFDVVASKSATITGFTANPISNGTDFEVYYRTGSFVGHETSSSGWILLDSSSNIPSGMGNIGVNISQPIIAGQTLGFYITSTTSGNYIYYDNGTSVGTVLASDGFLTIEEGVGKGYPFGGTNTTRNFVGSVLYEPEVTGLSWNISSDTIPTSSFTAQRSIAVTATGLVDGIERSGFEILEVTDVDVDVQASPAAIQSGQSSTLSSTVMASTGLATTFERGNNQDGAMFDVVASADADITGFSLYPQNQGVVDIEIFYKTGTHVGFEGSASAWTSLGTFTNIGATPSVYVALPSMLSVVSGQTVAFYITRTDGDYLYYTNGTSVGNVVNSDGVLQIEEGKGIEYPFGTIYTPRILNTIVHYEIENPSGATYSWSPSGGSSGSSNVSPTSTTTYTLTVGVNGCTEDESVTIVVDGIGLEEELLSSLEVYPNPANAFVNITWSKETEVEEISLYNLQGKLLFKESCSSAQEAAKIPVSNLAKGLCLLQVKAGGKQVSYKVQLK